MEDSLNFIVYCIEEYKSARCLRGKDVIALFNQYGVIDYIENHYAALCTTDRQYIVDDISEYIESRKRRIL